MARLRKRSQLKHVDWSEMEKELLAPELSGNKIFSKKEFQLEMERLKLEIKLNKQIRRLIDKQLKEIDTKRPK